MQFMNKEGNCIRTAVTPAKAERLRRQGFVPQTKPSAARSRKSERK